MKNIYNIIMCAGLLCGCSGDDVADGRHADAGEAPLAVGFTTDVAADDLWHDPVAPAPGTAAGARQAGAASRAAGVVNGLAGMKALSEGFGVYAYLTDDVPWTPGAGVPPALSAAQRQELLFMQNQPVVWPKDVDGTPLGEAATTGWQYEPLKYWPNSTGNATPRRISFFAYAPYVSDAEAAATAADPALTGVTALTGSAGGDLDDGASPYVEWQVGTGGRQHDLLWANCTNATRNGQGLIVPASATERTYQKVPLTFHHALSCVELWVQRVYDETGYTGKHPDAEEHTKLFVSRLAFAASPDLWVRGRLNLEDGQWTVGTGEGSTTAARVYDESVFDAAVGGTVRVASDANGPLYIRDLELDKWGLEGYGVDATLRRLLPEDSPLLFMPQDGAVTITPTMTYSMVTRDDALEYGYLEDSGGHRYTRIVNTTTGDSFRLTLEAGKKYTLVVHIGVETVRFEVVSVEDWDYPLRFTPAISDFGKADPISKTLSEE